MRFRLVLALLLTGTLAVSGCASTPSPPREANPVADPQVARLEKHVRELQNQVDGFNYIYYDASMPVEPEPTRDVSRVESGIFMGRIEEVATGTPRPSLVVDFITDVDRPENHVHTRSGWWETYGWNKTKHPQSFQLGPRAHLMVREPDLRAVSPNEFVAYWKAHLKPRDEADLGSGSVSYYIDVDLDGRIRRVWPVPLH